MSWVGVLQEPLLEQEQWGAGEGNTEDWLRMEGGGYGFLEPSDRKL